MAFTNSPSFQTYKTETVNLDDTSTYRSGYLTSVQRDSAIWNLFYDRVSQENKQRDVYLKKRPGLSASGYSLSKVSSSDVLRGSYYDATNNRFYWAVGNKVYYVAPDVGTTANLVTTLTTSTGYVGFCEFYKAASSVYYIAISDGQELWMDEIGGVATKVTSADLPVPHVPSPVSLDGYLFLAKANTNDMYNSNNDDPFTWTAGDYISAEMVGDPIIKLASNRNYIVALGVSSMEIFWNAAQASGSPMKRNESGFKRTGYVSNMCEIGDILYFVGQDKNKAVSVFKLDGFKLERISNEVVDRSLQTLTSANNVKSQVGLNKDGFCLSVDGHTFYCVVSGQTTWVYDVEEKFWYEWKNSSNNGLALEAAWGMYNGGQYVAVAGQSYISFMSPYTYQDFGTNFTCRYVTLDLTFGTSNWKTCHRLFVIGDMHNATGTSNLQVYWSDNDWADGGTGGPVNVNMFNSSPYAVRLGRFRNRSIKLEYSDNYPIRLKSIALDLNVGNI